MPSNSKDDKPVLTAGAIVGLLTALLAFLLKVWPDGKTPEQKTREDMAKSHAAEQKFQETGDTTDLGELP